MEKNFNLLFFPGRIWLHSSGSSSCDITSLKVEFDKKKKVPSLSLPAFIGVNKDGGISFNSLVSHFAKS